MPGHDPGFRPTAVRGPRAAVLAIAALVAVTARAVVPTWAAAPGTPAAPRGIRVSVLRVFDGDTVAVSWGETSAVVRLLGVDTPELAREDKAAEPYSREATRLTRRLLASASEVRLEVAGDRMDRYGRILGFLWLHRDGPGPPLNLSEALLAAGLARAMGHFEYPGKERFLELELRAKATGVGMWSGE